MEWTNQLIFEFLNLYHSEPSLWNRSIPEHKNRTEHHEAWRRIKDKLKDGGIPIREIKKKRDNLMATYRRQSRRVRQSLEPGSGVEVYIPEWPFYSVMASFLDEIYKPKNIKRSDDLQESDETKEENSIDEEDDRQENFKTPMALQKKTTKRVKLNDYDDRNSIDDAYNNFQDYPQSLEPDTCTLYCQLLCSKLRSLKENTRYLAMMEIDRVIYNLKQYDQKTVSSQYQIIPPFIQTDFSNTGSYLSSANHHIYSQQLKQESTSSGSQTSQQILVAVSTEDYPSTKFQSSPKDKLSCHSPSDCHSLNSQSSQQIQGVSVAMDDTQFSD